MRRHHRVVVRLVAAFVIQLALPAASVAQPEYQITTLFDVPGVTKSWATEINDIGQAVGVANFSDDTWGWLQDGDTILAASRRTTLQAPTVSGYMLALYQVGNSPRARVVHNGIGRPITNPLRGGAEDLVTARDVNEAGQATGFLMPNIDLMHSNPWPFIWQNGVTTLLEPDGTDGVGLDINDHGTVSGAVWLGAGPVPVTWSNGSRSLLAPGREGFAIRVNNAGQVLVDSPPYLWDNGTVVDLCLLTQDRCAQVIDLNEAGQVMARSLGPDATSAAVYRYDGADGWMDIGRIAPTHGMFPAALNDRGDVVGWAAVDYGFGDARAFGFIGGVLRDLTSLLPANSGWSRLLLALDINNRGEIVGVGLKDGLAAAFRMTPVEGGRLRP